MGEAQTFFNNPFLAEGWAKQGKKHVFLEIGPEHNSLLEKLFARKISDDDFIGTIRKEYSNFTNWAILQRQFRFLKDEDPAIEFARGIIHLRNAGIRVHGIDQPLDKKAFTPGEWKAIVAINRGEGLGLMGDALKHFVEDPKMATKAEIDRLRKKQTDVRLSADGATIDLAKKIAGGDPFIIIYGAGHFSNRHDMDELLGGNGKVATLALYPFEEVRRISENRSRSPDLPDYVLMVGDDLLELTPSGAKAGFRAFPKEEKQAQPSFPALRPGV